MNIVAAASRADIEPRDREAAMARIQMRLDQRHTAAVVTELRRAGLDPLVLKGVATQDLLYRGDVRTSCDIDLLVAPAEHRAAQHALGRLGYRRTGTGGHASTWIAEGRTPVDLHRTLPRCRVGPGAVWEALASHRRSIVVEGCPVPVLDAPAVAVHLTIHLTQTALERQVEDLRRAVAQLSWDDWIAATDLAQRLGTASSLAWALDQVPEGPALRQALGLGAVRRDQLPPRSPMEAGLRRFARSSVQWRERAGSLAAWLRVVGSRRSLAGWAVVHGRPRPASSLGYASTALARATHYLRRGTGES